MPGVVPRHVTWLFLGWCVRRVLLGGGAVACTLARGMPCPRFGPELAVATKVGPNTVLQFRPDFSMPPAKEPVDTARH